MRALTFRERLREEAAKVAAAESADPWRLALARVRGKVDFFDRLERISSVRRCWIFLRSRNAIGPRAPIGGFAKVMTELGWTAVRVRDLKGGGYREQVRGYCRDARQGRHAAPTATKLTAC